jgi:hypothetical protein
MAALHSFEFVIGTLLVAMIRACDPVCHKACIAIAAAPLGQAVPAHQS